MEDSTGRECPEDLFSKSNRRFPRGFAFWRLGGVLVDPRFLDLLGEAEHQPAGELAAGQPGSVVPLPLWGIRDCLQDDASWSGGLERRLDRVCPYEFWGDA